MRNNPDPIPQGFYFLRNLTIKTSDFLAKHSELGIWWYIMCCISNSDPQNIPFPSRTDLIWTCRTARQWQWRFINSNFAENKYEEQYIQICFPYIVVAEPSSFSSQTSTRDGDFSNHLSHMQYHTFETLNKYNKSSPCSHVSKHTLRCICISHLYLNVVQRS